MTGTKLVRVNILVSHSSHLWDQRIIIMIIVAPIVDGRMKMTETIQVRVSILASQSLHSWAQMIGALPVEETKGTSPASCVMISLYTRQTPSPHRKFNGIAACEDYDKENKRCKSGFK